MANLTELAQGSVGDRLRAMREQTDESARGLAGLAGLARSHVGLIENGTVDNPSGSTVLALARVLGCTAGWLLNGEGRPPSGKRVREAVADAKGASADAYAVRRGVVTTVGAGRRVAVGQ